MKKAREKLTLPPKSTKMTKGYYIARADVDFIEAEAERLSTDEVTVSQNEVLTAIINFWRDKK